MKNKNILLADKDESTRAVLLKYLRQLPYAFALSECRHGTDAIRYLNSIQPDLVFMSAELPGKDGFEVMDQAEYVPPVIMMSTSREYAARAFDYRVVDYLVKPLSKTRIECALQRLESWKRINHTERNVEHPGGYPRRIFVEKGTRLIGIPVEKITHLKADGDYTHIHTVDEKSYLCSGGIGHLERKFDPRHFIRVHRSYMVNVSYIQELYRDISKLFVALPNDVEISVGRNYLPAIKEMML